jgi:hypothetical protein
MYPSAKKNKNIRLYIVGMYPNGMPIRFSKAQNPLESNSQRPLIKNEEGSDGTTFTRTLGNYGLNSSNCINITIGGLSIYTPSQAFGTAGGGFYDSSNGYRVYAQATQAAQQTFKKVIPKIEKVVQLPIQENNVANIDYHFKEIREDNLDIIRQSPVCIPTDGEIGDYVNNIATNTNYSMSSPQKKASFRVPDVFPYKYGVSDGLNSLQISATDKGIYTTYSFEDRVIIPPSDSYVLQNLKDKSVQRGTIASSQVGSLDMGMVGRSFGKNF